jgi:hydroxymethylpyrimidine/phosphomethylpyrimidine kinase
VASTSCSATLSRCSFASAIAAYLAKGYVVDRAIGEAKEFVWRAVNGGAHRSLGAGHGPLDHFGWAH